MSRRSSSSPEPAPTAEWAPDVVQPEAPPPPPVEDAEPEAEELGDAVGEPAPAGPTSMPDWVASDVPPKSRRTRRKDGARARRDARRDRPRAARRRVAVAASWVVLCGFLASPLLAFIPSPSGERPTLAPDGVQSVPDAGDDAGHALRWDPVPKAAGYSVVFVNDGVRSDRWSQGAELRLPAGAESEQLVTYEWFVYPAFRDGAGYRYGPLVASGEVTMPSWRRPRAPRPRRPTQLHAARLVFASITFAVPRTEVPVPGSAACSRTIEPSAPHATFSTTRFCDAPWRMIDGRPP